MLNEAIDALNISPDGIYVDCTLGGAGHSREIAKRLIGGRLIGLDQDIDAINEAGKVLEYYSEKVSIFNENFRNIEYVLDSCQIKEVDGILMDLGVSSHQFDTDSRGFSYMLDAPLDMRMDRRNKIGAKEIINGYSEQELCRVIREYGEDPYARQIARRIVEARERSPIETTGELSDIIKRAYPVRKHREGTKGHPAKRTFQAIRIEVNHELEALADSIDKMIGLLKPGGRIVVISFHSLEDRIVKNSFKRNESPCICPPDFPICVCGRVSKGKVLTKKPIIPTDLETESNPRAKSAKLRAFEHC
ncbi:MAG: 16S rRNA (cytosine(1402)-N(4))-methyltransferase RsmH [Lachnospiraceae bacterium]|nr:16S rRNA (cytosine(1402)-N(4))-methyltransferase RsmH [Lachnospiraceae bacterium]